MDDNRIVLAVDNDKDVAEVIAKLRDDERFKALNVDVVVRPAMIMPEPPDTKLMQAVEELRKFHTGLGSLLPGVAPEHMEVLGKGMLRKMVEDTMPKSDWKSDPDRIAAAEVKRLRKAQKRIQNNNS